MSLFECKMCGGALEFTEGAAVAKCKYCGTAQTLPKTVDEIMQNLFVRANALRLKNEFDKAEKIYERIIQNDPTQSEAYWGLILCKYGIEYVDDPETKQKIPTCHRASYDSIIADDDFRLALEYADEDQRAVLDEQAREIDRIQKEILALAQKEETYDVFICYKETDENGKRTRDSVIANDIYYQLKQEGFKVFYAAITLENKLGAAYEPIIFAALHSAKVMLAIGTKPEYFNAVWVKNEWSRYLKVIQKDRTKLLIPCYRDMDAYELPDEFAHLQAQDMAKIGFINDLVRGVRKVIKKDAPKVAAADPVSSSPNTSALLKRAFIFLEDGDWSQADDFCEKVLNQDPENAQAYLGKLMAELHVSKQTMLEHCETPFDTNHNYMKAVRFADDALKTTLEGYAEAVRNRNQKMVAKKSKRKKKVALVIIPLVSLLVAAALVLNAFVVPKNEQLNNEPIPPSVTDSQALDATTQATETTAETPETTTKAPEATTIASETTTKAPETTTTVHETTKKVPETTTKAPETTTQHIHAFGTWNTVIPASCTMNGTQERICSCGEKEHQEIAAKGHTIVTDPAIAATCTATGLTEGSHCSVCNTVLEVQQTIVAKEHTPVTDAAKEATCTVAGVTEGSHCSVCNAVLTAQKTIAAKGHTPVIDAAKAATCTATGLTEGSHCSVCHVILIEQTEVGLKDHQLGNDHVCDICGITIPQSQKSIIIFEETFDYANNNDTTSVLKTIGWTKLTKAKNGVYNETDAEFAIIDGRLYWDNWDPEGLLENDTRVRGKDGYYQIDMLNDDFMKAVVMGKYTLQYDLEYTDAKEQARYAVIITECSADGQCYNSFHFRIGGYGTNQCHFYGSWKTFDAFDPTTDLYAFSQAKNDVEATTKGTTIAMKLLGIHYDGSTQLFKNIPVTIRQQWDPEMGHHVYMKTADMTDFVKVSEPSLYANGPMYIGWEGYAVQFKIGSSIDGYIDNIVLWTGWGERPKSSN